MNQSERSELCINGIYCMPIRKRGFFCSGQSGKIKIIFVSYTLIILMWKYLFVDITCTELRPEYLNSTIRFDCLNWSSKISSHSYYILAQITSFNEIVQQDCILPKFFFLLQHRWQFSAEEKKWTIIKKYYRGMWFTPSTWCMV